MGSFGFLPPRLVYAQASGSRRHGIGMFWLISPQVCGMLLFKQFCMLLSEWDHMALALVCFAVSLFI